MRFLYYLFILVLFTGCIDNDIPNPVVYGNVKSISVEGQEKVVIDTKERVVNITLSDNVDIEKVKLLTFECEASPAIELNIDLPLACNLHADTVLDLSKPFRFKISTYQDYLWQIVASQNMVYRFKVKDQVGEELINMKDKMITVYIPMSCSLDSVVVEDVQLGLSTAQMIPNPLEIRSFRGTQKIKVVSFGKTTTWSVFVQRTESADKLEFNCNSWTKHAYLSMRTPKSTSNTCYFEYKRSSDSQWIRAIAQGNGRDFSAKILNLLPNTKYDYRALYDNIVSESQSFITDKAEQLEYSNFDSWYKNGKAFYVGTESGAKIWDSGNKGGAGFGFNPTTEEKDDVVKNSAAKLSSQYALVKFAAGSLYTGAFAKLDVTDAELDFGIPYTSRPTSLTGYYKYIPGKINRIKSSNYEYLRNRTDSCHIYIALCDWTAPFRVKSKTNTFVDLSENNSSIIGLGQLISGETMTEYKKFTIDIEYRNLIKKPTYILIVATSSKYGDYFVGSDESVLLIDEFELGFD